MNYLADSKFHIEKNKLSHLMILSVYISLKFAKNKQGKRKEALLLLNIY